MKSECEERLLVDSYLDQLLSDEERKKTAAHFRSCPWCFRELSTACAFLHRLDLSRPRKRSIRDLFSPLKGWIQSLLHKEKDDPEITPPAFDVVANNRDFLMAEACKIVSDKTEADDVVQVLVLRALRTPLDIEAAIHRPWMLTCLRHVALSYIEGFGLNARTPLPPWKKNDFLEFTSWGRRVFHKRVNEALESMETQHADILSYVYLEGQDLPTVAEILGLPIGETRKTLAEARRKLRVFIEETEAKLWSLDFGTARDHTKEKNESDEDQAVQPQDSKPSSADEGVDTPLGDEADEVVLGKRESDRDGVKETGESEVADTEQADTEQADTEQADTEQADTEQADTEQGSDELPAREEATPSE